MIVDPPTTTVQLLGGPTGTGGGGGGSTAATATGEDIKTKEKDNDEDRISFGSLHAALGQSYVQDRLKRRAEQEVRLKDAEKTPEEKRDDESEKETRKEQVHEIASSPDVVGDQSVVVPPTT